MAALEPYEGAESDSSDSELATIFQGMLSEEEEEAEAGGEGRRINLLNSTGNNQPEFNIDVPHRNFTTNPPQDLPETKAKRVSRKLPKGDSEPTTLLPEGAVRSTEKVSHSKSTTRALFSK